MWTKGKQGFLHNLRWAKPEFYMECKMIIKNNFKYYVEQLLLTLIPILIFNIGLPHLLPILKVVGSTVFLLILVIAMAALATGKRGFIQAIRVISIVNFLAVLAMFLTFYISSFLVITDAIGFENFLRQNISTAKYIYFAICFAQPIILPLPEMVTVVAASAALGSFTAFILGFFGTILGIITMFFVSRIGGMKIVKRLVNEKHLEKYHQYVQKNELLILALLFIIPILPDEIICVGAGVSGVSVKRFLSVAIFSKIVTSFSLAYSIELASALSLTASQLMVFVSAAALLLFGIGMLIKKVLNKNG
jgi:uncharacterized membrane protein YdjX (TVP38/TMEM64 family)